MPQGVAHLPAPGDGPVTKAVVFLGPRRVAVGNVGLPAPDPEWGVEIETEVSAISVGTERWSFQGLRPDTFWPVVPGYLGCGRVTGLGTRVDHLIEGQRVIYLAGRQPRHFDGRNWMNAHSARIVASVDPAQYATGVDLPYVLGVPDEVSPQAASYAGLASVSLLGLDMVGLEEGQTVGIWGLGMVGQFSAQLARSRGARVFATDVSASRRALAASVPEALRPTLPKGFKDHEIEAEARAFAPEGFDIMMDCTGIGPVVNRIVHYLRQDGRFVFQAWYPGLPGIDLHAFHLRSTRSFHPCGLTGKGAAAALKAMAEGHLVVDPLITHRYRPEEAPGAYRALDRGEPSALGQVFLWKTATTQVFSREAGA